MVTKTICDPLIGTKTIKVAICSAFEAAQIVESSATPHEGLVRSLEKRGHGLRELLDSKSDPDQAAFLMWLGDGDTLSNIELAMVMSELVDQLGEEFRQTLLRQGETWPKEVEAYYKGQLFERAFRGLLSPVVFEKTEGEFVYPMTGDKIRIKITSGDVIGKETRTSRVGKCGKDREGNITIWLNEARWEEDLRIFILFHEIIHVKQRILKKLGMEILDLEGDTYQVSPKLDATVTKQIFEGALNSLL